MTYLEVTKYLESFINYEQIPAYPYRESLRLERIRNFLDTIGNPQKSLQCIHIAGTKGKGSTCAFAAYILRQAGYRVGLYTSPHLVSFRERIRVLDDQLALPSSGQDFEGMISEKELTQLVERLKPEIEEYNKNSKYGPLSFFEAYTSLALVYFKEKKIDFAVLETGLGGRLDATNVVNPYVCAITPLSYEHTQKLGNSLREIATEKAGIIKAQNAKCLPCRQAGKAGKMQNLIVISAPQEKEAFQVIRNRCTEVGAKLYEVNKDIFYEKAQKGFNLMGIFGEYPNLELRLLGEHQMVNASVAVAVVEAMRFYNIHIGSNAIREGLYNTVWPGRCEVVSKDPLVVLDGAQNVASARALKNAVRENFRYKKIILVLGISSDKNIKGICDELYGLVDAVILTRADSPRATKPEALAEYFKAKKAYITGSVEEASNLANRIAKREDLILVCGSLFVVGESRTLFKGAG